MANGDGMASSAASRGNGRCPQGAENSARLNEHAREIGELKAEVRETRRTMEAQREAIRGELNALCANIEKTVEDSVNKLRHELDERRGKVTLNYRTIVALFGIVLAATMAGSGIPEWLRELIATFK